MLCYAPLIMFCYAALIIFCYTALIMFCYSALVRFLIRQFSAFPRQLCSSVFSHQIRSSVSSHQPALPGRLFIKRTAPAIAVSIMPRR